jgi:beta-lactamase superfamily II metal-dependent hydrolase
MDCPSIHILDVGHGNCCVVIDTRGVTVIDGGTGEYLRDFMDTNEIREVATILLSHADADHVAGLTDVLMREDVTVREVYLNPDSRKTRVWKAFRRAVRDARARVGTKVHIELTTTVSGMVHAGEQLEVQVLLPEPHVAAGASGGSDLEDRRISSNRMSAVIRVLKEGDAVVLLPGDLDTRGLDELSASGSPYSARILVFPHHGGQMGRNSEVEFARRLLSGVRPELVVFSIGGLKYNTPRPNIVDAAKSNGAHVMCTQLSKACCDTLPGTLVSGAPRRSTSSNACAGTISVRFTARGLCIEPNVALHSEFVEAFVRGRLCTGDTPSIPLR